VWQGAIFKKNEKKGKKKADSPSLLGLWWCLQATEAAAAAASAEQQQQQQQQGHSGQGQQQQSTGSASASDSGQGAYAGGNVINLDSHLAAKAARPTGAAGAGRKTTGAVDDWGEEPLGDDLLPM